MPLEREQFVGARQLVWLICEKYNHAKQITSMQEGLEERLKSDVAKGWIPQVLRDL